MTSLVMVLATVMAVLLFYVAAYARVTSNNHRKALLQRELDRVRTRRERLEVLYNRLITQGRILEQARARGMVMNPPAEPLKGGGSLVPAPSFPRDDRP